MVRQQFSVQRMFASYLRRAIPTTIALRPKRDKTMWWMVMAIKIAQTLARLLLLLVAIYYIFRTISFCIGMKVMIMMRPMHVCIAYLGNGHTWRVVAAKIYIRYNFIDSIIVIVSVHRSILGSAGTHGHAYVHCYM